MKQIIFVLLVLLAVPAFGAGKATLIDNLDCTGLNEPYNCCSDFGVGNCDGKVAVTFIVKRLQMIDACAGYWYRGCSQSDVPQICTQEEVDAGAALPTVTCNQNRVDNNECRARMLGSDNMPKVGACRKSFPDYLQTIWKQRRDVGRREWRAQDTSVDDTDPIN